ncbi:mCG145585, partial [Mus musculus]
TYVPDPPLDKLPCFIPLDLVGQKTWRLETTFRNLIRKRSYDESSLSFNVTGYSDSIMDCSNNQSNIENNSLHLEG